MRQQVVISDVAPLFRQPEENAERTDEALMGMVVEVTGTAENGFVPVRTHYRYEGYMPVSCLSNAETDVDAWASVPKWAVWSPYLDIQVQPRVQASVMASCPRGGLLAVIPGGTNGGGTAESRTHVALSNVNYAEGWTNVGLPDGRSGYVRTACIAPQASAPPLENPLRGKLVSAAKLYMHTQYRWGGKSPLGIDCSGLTSMAYMLNGIIIYRDSDIRPGFPVREVPCEAMAAGDLLFFKGHVAMYIGGGEYIHSTAFPASGGVTINSLDPAHPAYREDLANGILKIGSVFPYE
ncbi:MAG: NlpC/P60 family protein [Defluviitaleaceae bacterium]|nr:NlpC/P60 family protein [Defluviitaleaceae bacterium]